MADISDVTAALATTLSAAIYPFGTSQPSITGAATKIYPGWPIPNNLDADLIAGTVNLSIYPLPTERTESIINLDAVTQNVAAAGTVLTVAGNQITVTGVPVVGDVAVIYKNYAAYAYAILSNSTLTSIAAALASLIGGTSSSGVVTAPAGTYSLAARVSTPGTLIVPMERICRMVQVTTWANTPALRDSTAKAARNALWNAERIVMDDGTWCGIIYKSSPMTDDRQKANLYRRDIIIQVDFVSTQADSGQTVAEVTNSVSTTSTPVVSFNTNG